MKAGEACNRDVVIADRSESAREAARLMREHHVGDVVIVQSQGAKRVPVGILTDRDLVVEVIAAAVDPESVRVGDVMSPGLETCGEGEELAEAIKRMAARGIRRLPVVSQDGALAGILAVDDVIELLAEQMNDLIGLVKREQERERRIRN